MIPFLNEPGRRNVSPNNCFIYWDSRFLKKNDNNNDNSYGSIKSDTILGKTVKVAVIIREYCIIEDNITRYAYSPHIRQ